MTTSKETSGGEKPQDLIARLERELTDLWKPPTNPTELPMSRVCMMNLEVIAESADVLDHYMSVVDAVTAAIPSRAIVASVEPNAPDDPDNELEGSATAICSVEGQRKICGERITLSAKGPGCARLASAILSLRIAEIPTVLVWLGHVHLGNPIFEDLAQSADRIIIDSEFTSLASLVHLASWARKRRERGERDARGPNVADLAWTRLAPWQEFLARFFDNGAHDAHAGLAMKITKLELVQASEPGEDLGPEPALLLGWLATRLGWKISPPVGAPFMAPDQGAMNRAPTINQTQFVGAYGHTPLLERPDGVPVVLALRSVARPSGVAPKALAALAIEAQSDNQKASYRIVRELASGMEGNTPDNDMVSWRKEITGAAPVEQRFRLGSNKAAKWLERTLHRRSHDPAFDESVEFAEHLIGISP
ncbi:MAG: glucose-6-phosphate dehydrogenase assembly protein OpcA [Polyangiaceae bacterium]|nr:glucose-6-phosphate dehydrogenase assembly protein OpcA [Polyangiaceae bacterium]